MSRVLLFLLLLSQAKKKKSETALTTIPFKRSKDIELPVRKMWLFSHLHILFFLLSFCVGVDIKLLLIVS